jgi:hypothetical protein
MSGRLLVVDSERLPGLIARDVSLFLAELERIAND